ncbi:hypothetical protein O4J56_22195 [Nocardiopsis sp. RSe5-2]|uniref:LapA family protein n=1 Tax=Nocardiopsis endophytica TaxID=3018445 RepID=A0ABT4U8U3_9ACTN|nr:hypothetical protein [Nocardiopsis endophytica]MDA2813373.1 hypothetical protein [Nocardiopsis endophytica]
MAVLFTALACFIAGAITGWVLTSNHATWSMDRIVARQQREIHYLRELLVESETAARRAAADAARHVRDRQGPARSPSRRDADKDVDGVH